MSFQTYQSEPFEDDWITPHTRTVLRRPKGTYGSVTEDYLNDGTTPFVNLMLAGDGCFPGIGVPAVAISGASAANALVGVVEQWLCLDKLKRKTL